MILTCPSCTMRYIVSEGAIGPNGRTVRCAHCSHQWFEAGEEGLDEALFDQELPSTGQYNEAFEQAGPEPEPEIDFQAILQKELEAAPIPEGVKPAHEEYDPVLAQLGPQKQEASIPSGAKLGGFMTAGLIWVFILAGLLFLQPHISRAFPASNMIYSLIGMKPAMPGEGLALDGLHAEIADGKITMKGNVINLRETDEKVPAILASIVDQDEKLIDSVLIPPPVARIKPEGQATFDAVYPKIPDGATNVTFAFSFIKAKPAEAQSEAAAPAAEEAEHHAEEPAPAAEPDHH